MNDFNIFNQEGIIIFNNEEIIKKANNISFANLENKLTITQMNLFSFAVLKLPLGGTKATFTKGEFTDFLEIREYRKRQIDKDKRALIQSAFTFSDTEFTDNLDTNRTENERGYSITVAAFESIEYHNGLITVQFTKKLTDYIHNLGAKYLLLDLSIMKRFNSEFSWFLYEKLKTEYNNKFTNLKRATISVDELRDIFGVSNVKSYSHFGLFRQKVLEVAIEEVNRLTEINIKNIDFIRHGRKVTDVIFEWTLDKVEYSATKSQLEYIEGRARELLSRPDFTNRVESQPLMLVLNKVGDNIITKGNASELIKKIDTTIKQLDTYQGDNEFTINSPESKTKIKQLTLEKMENQGFTKTAVDFFGENLFDKALEISKKNMKHIDSIESVSSYTAKVIADLIKIDK